MRSKVLNIATFNVHGLKTNDLKKKSLVQDAEKYNISIMGITETHIKENSTEQVEGDQRSFTIYHNGIEGQNDFTGVGILIDEAIPATFTRVNDRICYAEIVLGNHTLLLLVAYAPTLAVSEKRF